MVVQLWWNLSRGAQAAACVAATIAALVWVSSASAAVIVNDTWRDGERYQPAGPLFVPAPPPYAENNGLVGNDADGDGDLESAWFRGGAGTMDPVAAGGPLRFTTSGSSSASWTTYFTGTEGSEVELANAGDSIRLTWVFTLDGVNSSNSSQAFRLAVVDSPNNRMTANGSPGSGAYTGYAILGNMGQTFAHASPFALRGRTGNGAALSATDQWATALDVDGTNGNPGYVNGVEYTYTFMATRTAGGELDILMRMDGAGLDGAAKNHLEVTYLDATPASFKFDTFTLRPSNETQTATTWDTSLFRVEFNPAIPEPASIALLSLGCVAFLGMARRR